jgi:hypothetical protein
MSLAAKDRNFRPESEKGFAGDCGKEPNAPFAAVIAHALHVDFGETPSRIKIVARLTGANQHTVKNWFDGKNAPNGEHLVVLMRHSNLLLETILRLAGHGELSVALALASTRARLVEMLAALDRLGADAADGPPAGGEGQ